MSRSRIGSLGGRLSLWLALQSFAGLVFVCATVYGLTVTAIETRQLEELAQKETQLRHLLEESAAVDDSPGLVHKLDDFFIGHQDLGLSLLRPDGSIFYQSAQYSAPRAHAPLARLALPPAAATGRGALSGILTLDTRDDGALLRRIGLTLLMAALMGTVVVSAGGFLLVRLGLRPLRELVEQTRQLAADTLHRRLDGSAQPEELEPLIAQFNELLGRLEQAYEQLEGFNADVAHELCTPLATLIGSTELALRKARDAGELREVLGSNLEELQRMASIVHDMLFLSQADRGASARRLPTVSLAAEARLVAEYHEAALTEAGLLLEVSGDTAGAFDTPLVRRALSNLIANATRHAQRGTTVRIEMAAAQPDEVALTVENLGDTVAAAHLPRLFDRFYRADSARSDADRNHGLGLSIVAAIARMHGGTTIARSAAGATTIGITLKTGSPPPSGPVDNPSDHRGLTL